MASSRPHHDRNEGEGSRTAARRYQAGVARTVASGDVERLAREAARSLDGPEGGGLRRAEAKAKQRATPVPRRSPRKTPQK